MKIAILAAVILTGCTHTSSADTSTKALPQKGLFVSLDGMQSDFVDAAVSANIWNSPNGFQRILAKGIRVQRAVPAEVSLTAPSHVSNITCSKPSQHGIYSNTLLIGGQKYSGFSQEIKTEALWEAVRRQGYKVMSFGYAGLDGDSPRRTANQGVSFPSEDVMGEDQKIEWVYSGLTSATSWRAEGPSDQKEALIEVTLNKQTKEVTRFNALIVPAEKNVPGRIIFDNDKDLKNGVQGEIVLDGTYQTINLFAIERHPNSTLRGYKRRIWGRLLNADTQRAVITLSAASYNKAHPEEFRKFLDDQDLVWPAQHLKYDSPTGLRPTPDQIVRDESVLNDTITKMAVASAKKYPFDVILFYQTLMDTIAHSLQNQLPLPMNLNGKDPVSQAYRLGLMTLDQNIASVMSALPRDIVTTVVGDHGMAPLKNSINLAAVMSGLGAHTITQTSGAQLVLYAKSDKEAAKLEADELIAKLSAITIGGEGIVDLIFRPESGSAWAFGEGIAAVIPKPGFTFTKDNSKEIFLAPRGGGNHGFDPSHPTMHSIILMNGSGIPEKVIPKASLLDAAATFSKALHIEQPAQCTGNPLF